MPKNIKRVHNAGTNTINRQYNKHLNEFTIFQLKFIEKKHNELK